MVATATGDRFMTTTHKFFQFFLVAVVSIFAVNFLIGCDDDPPPPDPLEMHRYELEKPVDTPNSVTDTAEAHARHYSKKAGYGLAWALNALLIFAVPLLALAIPGSIFDRPQLEKVAEGALVLVAGIFFYWLTDDLSLGSLPTCAMWVNIVPGAMLLLWGIISEEESGKTLLLGLPSGAMFLWILGQVWIMFSRGLVLAPITTILLIVAKFFLLSFIFGREGARA